MQTYRIGPTQRHACMICIRFGPTTLAGWATWNESYKSLAQYQSEKRPKNVPTDTCCWCLIVFFPWCNNSKNKCVCYINRKCKWIFFKLHITDTKAHNTRTLTLYEHTHANPTSRTAFLRLHQQISERSLREFTQELNFSRSTLLRDTLLGVKGMRVEDYIINHFYPS